MKSLIYTLIWTTLFISFGFYVNSEIYEFTDKYTSKIDIIEIHIKQNNWESAKTELDKYNKAFYSEKNSWYKLLNHDYFDSLCLYLDILDGSIYSKDKSMSFEQIVRIKATLNYILESERCDLNHIF